jgi:lipoprotein-anchoring transpeptidase ErfK/SrfK
MTQRAPQRPLIQRSFLIPAVIVAVLLVAAIGAYAYDSSRDDLIAEGVTVAGVDVGGMRADEAKAVVRRQVGGALQRPIEVAAGRKHYDLSPRSVDLRPEVDRMVAEAVDESRDGNILGRVVRDVTGGDENAELPARVSYSKPAADRFVRNVERRVNRPAQDAKLNFPALTRVKEKDGVRIQDDSFRRRVVQALTVPGVDQVTVPRRILHPKVTRAELAAKYPTLVVVERGAFRLTLYKKLHRVRSYPIAVGQIGLETPAGMYKVENKAVNPAWHVPTSSWAGSLAGTVVPGGTAQNPLKARWLGIFAGAGIHGTDQLGSLGTAASHGCIRMAIPDVIELYDKVPTGAPVYIA